MKGTDHNKHYKDVGQLEPTGTTGTLACCSWVFRNDGAVIKQILPNPIQRITA